MYGVSSSAIRKFQLRPTKLKKVLVTSFCEKPPRNVIFPSPTSRWELLSVMPLDGERRLLGQSLSSETQYRTCGGAGGGVASVLAISEEEVVADGPEIK